MELIGHILYLLFIFPFEYVFSFILKICLTILPHGYALLLMSLVVNILTLPIMSWAKKIENKEREKQFKVKQEVITVKKEYKGEEAFRKIDAIYKKNHYSALLAFRSDLSIFLQIPIFVAAITTLDNNPAFNDVSFWMIDDLGEPDHLFFGYNFLPFFMTAVNLFSIKLYNNDNKFFDRVNIKLIIIALLFLVYLYGRSSALMVYWTCNNVLSTLIIVFGFVNKHKEMQ